MFSFKLHPNEKLINMYRQTELVLAKYVLIIFLLIYVPWYFLIKYELLYEYRRLVLLGTVLVLFYGINKYLLWLLNVILLTNSRLVEVHYKSLFKKLVVETPLSHISGIGYRTTGISSSIFNFGNLEVKTLGVNEPIVLKHIRNVADVKDEIWQARSLLKEIAKPETPQDPEPELPEKVRKIV